MFPVHVVDEDGFVWLSSHEVWSAQLAGLTSTIRIHSGSHRGTLPAVQITKKAAAPSTNSPNSRCPFYFSGQDTAAQGRHRRTYTSRCVKVIKRHGPIFFTQV